MTMMCSFLKYVRLLSPVIVFGAAVALAVPAAAAQQPAPQEPAPQMAPAADTAQPYPDCGTWQSGTWVASGKCGASDYRSHVAGTITGVKGHLVTLQQTTQSLVINDGPALERQDSGKVAVGRQVSAIGYWRNGTFYATGLHSVASGGPGPQAAPGPN
jgi:hypothetical protein